MSVHTYLCNSSYKPDILLQINGVKYYLHSALAWWSDWFDCILRGQDGKSDFCTPLSCVIPNVTEQDVATFFDFVYANIQRKAYKAPDIRTKHKHEFLAAYLNFRRFFSAEDLDLKSNIADCDINGSSSSTGSSVSSSASSTSAKSNDDPDWYGRTGDFDGDELN